MKKALASCIAFGIVGLQLYVILPGGPAWTWYWPFVDYQMYAIPFERGAPMEGFEVRLERCGAGLESVPIASEEFGISVRRLQILLEKPAEPEPHASSRVEIRSMLSSLVEDAFPGEYCGIQVWMWSLSYGTEEVRSKPPVRMMERWPLPGHATDGA